MFERFGGALVRKNTSSFVEIVQLIDGRPEEACLFLFFGRLMPSEVEFVINYRFN